MVNRTDIGKREGAKALKRLKLKKLNNPEKYEHKTTEKSKYLGMNYDFKMGSLSPYKMEEYQRLKKIYGDD